MVVSVHQLFVFRVIVDDGTFLVRNPLAVFVSVVESDKTSFSYKLVEQAFFLNGH